jgi:mannose-1-phosphate guanylyltransferase/phosphomannomutase
MIGQAVISAGGQGTRMSGLFFNFPKLLHKIGDKSVLEHSLVILDQNGIKHIHLLLGMLAEPIIAILPELSEKYGVVFSYKVEEEPLGTGGSLLNSLNELQNEFILLYGDLFINSDLSQLVQGIHQEDVDFAQLVHPTNHPEDSDLLQLDFENRIIRYLPKPHKSGLVFNNIANSGIYAFKKSALLSRVRGLKIGKIDLDRELLPYLVSEGMKGKAIRNYGYVRDVGTPQRFEAVNDDYKSGRTNLKSRPAIFLDRDGTLNESNGYITKAEQLTIFKDVGPFIAKANNLGFLVFLVTNQPVIARGDASFMDIGEIHAKLETIVAKYGGYFDSIFVCPHHPDSGFPGELIDLKKECQCRKPEIGMFTEAISLFAVDTTRSIMIGDTDIDQEFARRANIRFTRIVRNSEFKVPGSVSSLEEIVLEIE